MTLLPSHWRRRWIIAFLGLILGLALISYCRLHLGSSDQGNVRISLAFWSLRTDAIIVAAIAGSALAVAGVLLQGLFRNPLADPGIIGVGAGANLGGMLTMVACETALVQRTLPINYELVLPIGCVLGAVSTLGILLIIMRFNQDSVTVLLAGMSLSMLLLSIGALVKALVAERWEMARALMTFAMGDITGKGMQHVRLTAPLAIAGFAAAWVLGRHLDILLSGEEEARSLGVDVGAVRFWILIFTSLLVAAAVTLGGNIAFVGLMVPHVLRRLIGTNHRGLLPLAALGGAVLVIACDCVSVALDTRSVIPLGVIVGIIGAPLLFFMFLKNRNHGVH